MRAVAVVGGGVAGLAAACALASSGHRVSLLERRPYLGGRASSYSHPVMEEVVDCQHVLLGCCTNLLDLYTRLGAAKKIRWFDKQTFLESSGRASTMAVGALPAPFHFLGSFLSARMLRASDKVAIASGMMHFLRSYPSDYGESMAEWLRRTRQTDRAIRHFWNPVMVATLNDSPERCSTRYAGQVFRELFIRTGTGARLGIPTVPLSDLYSRAEKVIAASGGAVRVRASVDGIVPRPEGGWCLRTADGEYQADAVVSAIPFEQMRKLLPALASGALAQEVSDLEAKIEQLQHSPYTTVHLWYDREVTELDHAWLLDSPLQWMFHKSRIRGYPREQGSYLELVIAASEEHLHMERSAILAQGTSEIQRFLPGIRGAKLLKTAILKEARATFSVLPGSDAFRPGAETAWPGLFLAGDWTASGWPSTMEGAARSGYLAAEALTRAAGDPQRFLVPDLPTTGFMRLIG